MNASTGSAALALGLLLAACAGPPQRAAAADAAPPTMADFSDRATYFYLAPSRESFDTLQQESEALRPQLTARARDGEILTAVVIARIAQAHGWPIADSVIGKEAQDIAAGGSPLARYVDDDAQVDAAKLDIWWAGFFATGDESYLERLFRYATAEPPKGDLRMILVDGVAGWSFKANSRQHRKVLEFARRKLAAPETTAAQARFLGDCIAYAEAEPGLAR